MMREIRDGINVTIYDNPARSCAEIYIYELLPNDKIGVVEPMELVFTEKERGTSMEPSMTIPYLRGGWSEFLQRFQEAISKHGIKLEEESVTKGKLIATQKHLEDMRKTVFKKLKLLEVKE
jgi:hypothetical protein